MGRRFIQALCAVTLVALPRVALADQDGVLSSLVSLALYGLGGLGLVLMLFVFAGHRGANANSRDDATQAAEAELWIQQYEKDAKRDE